MKILHIGKYYPPFMGGIENFMQLLMEQQKNFTIKAIVHQHKNSSLLKSIPVQREYINNIEVIRVPSYGRLLFAPVSPSFPYYLSQEIKSFQPDILHIHMPNTSAFWVLFSGLAKNIPWVIHWHADVVASEHDKLLAMAYPFYRPFETAMLKKAKAIITTSPDYLASSIPLQKWKKKTHIIPLALNNSQQASKASVLEQDCIQLWGEKPGKNPVRLLAIGRLTYYKGYQDLILAMKHIPNAKLVIVGTGEQKDLLENLISQHNLNESIQLAGKVEENTLQNLLASCDIFCMSSIERTEAFGLVLLEAMSYAKPIVITKVAGSGMNWVTQDNQTALFAEKQNPEDLADKINRLINNTELAKTLGENGYKRLQEHFQIKTIAEQTGQVYNSVVKTN